MKHCNILLRFGKNGTMCDLLYKLFSFKVYCCLLLMCIHTNNLDQVTQIPQSFGYTLFIMYSTLFTSTDVFKCCRCSKHLVTKFYFLDINEQFSEENCFIQLYYTPTVCQTCRTRNSRQQSRVKGPSDMGVKSKQKLPLNRS